MVANTKHEGGLKYDLPEFPIVLGKCDINAFVQFLCFLPGNSYLRNHMVPPHFLFGKGSAWLEATYRIKSVIMLFYAANYALPSPSGHADSRVSEISDSKTSVCSSGSEPVSGHTSAASPAAMAAPLTVISRNRGLTKIGREQREGGDGREGGEGGRARKGGRKSKEGEGGRKGRGGEREGGEREGGRGGEERGRGEREGGRGGEERGRGE